jgi:pyrroline-5-carboxylate reductase
VSNINKIGFIGFGKMAEALASGFLASNNVNKEAISFTEHNEERARDVFSKYGFTPLNIEELVTTNDLIFVAIKPQQINDLLPQLKGGPTYISLLAGTPISTFEKVLGNGSFIRIMPNTPALVSKGMFAITSNKYVSDDTYNTVSDLLSSLGEVIDVEEAKMDAVTGISGSGPAFVYTLADAFIKAALKHGFDDETARQLAAQTFSGASEMILKTTKPVAELISDVRSPNGTTDAGLKVLEGSTIQAILTDAIEAAISRSKDLG